MGSTRPRYKLFIPRVQEVLEPLLGGKVDKATLGAAEMLVQSVVRDFESRHRITPFEVLRGIQAQYSFEIENDGSVSQHGLHIGKVEPDNVTFAVKAECVPDYPTEVKITFVDFEIIYSIDAAMFRDWVGRDPQDDDLERVNCKTPGQVMHLGCGWCTAHSLPRFQCGCVGKPMENRADQEIENQQDHPQ